jgi:hypothetical protein
MSVQNSLFQVGDRVRFERFGEWLDGTVIVVERGLICIEYGKHGASTWRLQTSKNVALTGRVS